MQTQSPLSHFKVTAQIFEIAWLRLKWLKWLKWRLTGKTERVRIPATLPPSSEFFAGTPGIWLS